MPHSLFPWALNTHQWYDLALGQEYPFLGHEIFSSVVHYDSSKYFAIGLPTYKGSPYILGRSDEAMPRLVFEKHLHDLLLLAAAVNQGKGAL